jgi:hypothetical protein
MSRPKRKRIKSEIFIASTKTDALIALNEYLNKNNIYGIDKRTESEDNGRYAIHITWK